MPRVLRYPVTGLYRSDRQSLYVKYEYWYAADRYIVGRRGGLKTDIKVL